MKSIQQRSVLMRASISPVVRGFIFAGLMLGTLASGVLGSMTMLAYSEELFSVDMCLRPAPLVTPHAQDAQHTGSPTG